MELKKLNVCGREVEFVNNWRGTRSGFAHDTTLFINGIERVTATCHYINRTWECYAYQTVMCKAVAELKERLEGVLTEQFKAERGYKKITENRRVELNAYLNANEDYDFYRVLLNELRRR